MAKTISNKKYDEFWNKDELNINTDENSHKKESVNKEDISKQVKKEVKKEVKKLEEQFKEIIDEKISSSVSDSVVLNDDKVELINDAKPNLKKEIELINDISSNSLIINEKQNINVDEKKVVKKEQVKSEGKKIEEKKVKKEEVKIEEKPIMEVKSYNIYENYVLENERYKIYFRGNLIYDSVNHKEKPIFNENGFILFGKNYIYRGIRFEKY